MKLPRRCPGTREVIGTSFRLTSIAAMRSYTIPTTVDFLLEVWPRPIRLRNTQRDPDLSTSAGGRWCRGRTLPGCFPRLEPTLGGRVEHGPGRAAGIYAPHHLTPLRSGTLLR